MMHGQKNIKLRILLFHLAVVHYYFLQVNPDKLNSA